MAKPKLRKKRPPIAPFNKMEAIKPFIIRLHELCKAMNCEAMQHINSKEAILRLAHLRYKIGAINHIYSDYTYTRPYKSIFNKLIKAMLKTHGNTIQAIPIKTSFEDLTYLDALDKFLKDDYLQNSSLSDKLLKQLRSRYHDDGTMFCQKLLKSLIQVSFIENLPDEALLSMASTPALITHQHQLFRAELNFQLYLQRPKKEFLNINGQKRLVHPIILPLYANTEFHQASINTKQIGNLYQGDKEHLNLYIQPHAVQRLRDRIAPINDMFIKLYFSLCMLHTIEPICRTEKLYIPFRLYGITVGYFVAVVADNKVVIKTFILASHASAPEGRIFQKLTGFRKHDMSYWDITRLDTFINNDMKPDNPLYPYFEESGLLQLFDLDDSHVLSEDKCNKEANWQQILDCINKQQKHETLSQKDLQNTNLTEAMA